MDLLDDYLAGVRSRGAVFCRSIAEPPWSIRREAPAPLSLITMITGSAWFTSGDGTSAEVRKGDIVLIRGTAAFTAGDHPDTAPQVVVEDADRCWLVEEGPASAGRQLMLGPRTYGLSVDGSDLFVTGEYPMTGEVGDRLLHSLPDVAVVPWEPGFAPLLEVLAAEVVQDEPGQQIILDRLLDLLLVRALRSWFARPEADPPAGYRALADPQIGRALRALHDHPGGPWTVASLAAEAGMSRAVFARRFGDLVGQPPLAYLTEWRMALAADLLRDQPDESVASVARKVGYADGFAFSNAFKRVKGIAPSMVRAQPTP